MSEPIRAPANAWPGSGLASGASAGSVVLASTIIGGNTGGSSPDCAGKLADGPGGHNLIGNIGTGTATGACSGLTNCDIGAGSASTCEQAPIGGMDQRGDNRNATTRGGCDIGAYDTGGAS